MDKILRINETDKLIAEKVMGWELCSYGFWETEFGDLDAETEFNPSSDINDAMLVLDKLKIGLIPQAGGPPDECKYYAEIDNDPIGNSCGAFAETIPLAICRVALKSVGLEAE